MSHGHIHLHYQPLDPSTSLVGTAEGAGIILPHSHEEPPFDLSLLKLLPGDGGLPQGPKSLSPHPAGGPCGHPWQAALGRAREDRGLPQLGSVVSPTSLSRISFARSLMSCEGLKCSGSSSSCSAKAYRTAMHRVNRSATESRQGCPSSGAMSTTTPPPTHRGPSMLSLSNS